MQGKNTIFLINSLLLFVFSNAIWSQTHYSIQADLDSENRTITVSQTVVFENSSELPLTEIYLNDWANSYEGTESPLVKHLANQFNRSFYFSAKSKLGYTSLKSISSQGEALDWSRLEEQLDLIKISLKRPLSNGESLQINLKYQLQLPDDKFTGFGISSNNTVLFRDFFISVSPFKNKKWLLQSNLGLRDNSHLPSNYNIHWSYPKNYKLTSNLIQSSSETIKEKQQTISYWSAQNLSSPEFVFSEKDDFQEISVGDQFTIATDILPSKNTSVDFQKSLNQIYRFTSRFLGPLEHQKILVLKKDYAKNPIVGITEALSFLKPFSEEFIYETKFIKAFLASYLHELLEIDKRKRTLDTRRNSNLFDDEICGDLLSRQ